MSEMRKENSFFFSFPSASTFDKVKGTNKRAKNKIKGSLFIFSFECKCLALKNVESKTTFKNGENRRFRFVGVAGTRTKAQKRQKAQVFG